MIRQNLHTHSLFDDGQNTMEEMVRAALSAGLDSLGFSVHSPLSFDDGWVWTISKERLPDYMAEARRLKEVYRGRIALYCGVEWDTLSDIPLEGFDYVIGSVHHIVFEGKAYSVDATADYSAEYLERVFHGDADKAAEFYFNQYIELAQVDEVDIVGHFDLLNKFDATHSFYNPDLPRYHAAALSAMDALASAGKIFEINTGAVARGYRTKPYPSGVLLSALQERGGRITISSDAHRAGDVIFGFSEAEALAREIGFRELWMFDGARFVPVPIEKA